MNCGRPPMKKILSLFLLATLLSGCQTSSPMREGNTLVSNTRIPHRLIAGFYEPAQWRNLENLPFDAYVVLRGTVNNDRTVRVNRVLQSYPNDQRIAKAKEMMDLVRLFPNTVGTRVPPSAEIFVVFYETHANPNTALVFARQIGAAPSTTGDVGGNLYLGIRKY